MNLSLHVLYLIIKSKINTMKTLKTIVSMWLITAALPLFGQATSENITDKAVIEITGTAERDIVPDEIYITITIKERHEGKKKISIEDQEKNFKQALKSINVSLDDLSLDDANANYISVKWRKKDVITKTEYTLKVENTLMLGKVFKKLDELNILGAYVSRVSHSKILEFKKEVRIDAIKAAKEKADYLLDAIGEETGKPLKINEVTHNNLMANSLNVRSSEMYNGNISNSFTLQFKKIKLQSSIYVKFEIK